MNTRRDYVPFYASVARGSHALFPSFKTTLVAFFIECSERQGETRCVVYFRHTVNSFSSPAWNCVSPMNDESDVYHANKRLDMVLLIEIRQKAGKNETNDIREYSFSWKSTGKRIDGRKKIGSTMAKKNSP